MTALKLAPALGLLLWAASAEGKPAAVKRAPAEKVPEAAEPAPEPLPPYLEVDAPRGPDVGYYLGAEVSAVQVSGEDLVVGVSKNPANGLQTGDLLALDYGVNPAFRYYAGYAFEDGAFEASYWTYQQGAHVERNAGGGVIAVSFGNPGSTNTQYQFVTSHASLRTNQIDLAWKQRFYQSDRVRLSWSTGLRGWNLRETIDSQGYTPGTDSELNHVDSYSYGGGFTAGLAASARLLSGLTAVIAGDLGYLVGRTSAHVDDLYRAGANATSANVSLRPRRGFEQVGVSAKLKAELLPGLDGAIGATYKRFGDARTEINAVCMGGDGCNVNETFVHSLDFSGASGELSYRF